MHNENLMCFTNRSYLGSFGLRSMSGTVTYICVCSRGELLFIMALLGRALQTHQTGQVPSQGGKDIQLDFDEHLSLDAGRYFQLNADDNLKENLGHTHTTHKVT